MGEWICDCPTVQMGIGALSPRIFSYSCCSCSSCSFSCSSCSCSCYCSCSSSSIWKLQVYCVSNATCSISLLLFCVELQTNRRRKLNDSRTIEIWTSRYLSEGKLIEKLPSSLSKLDWNLVWWEKLMILPTVQIPPNLNYSVPIFQDSNGIDKRASRLKCESYQIHPDWIVSRSFFNLEGNAAQCKPGVKQIEWHTTWYNMIIIEETFYHSLYHL